MADFNVVLNGKWFFDYTVVADSLEEAVAVAQEQMSMESGNIDLHFTRIVVEDDKTGSELLVVTPEARR